MIFLRRLGIVSYWVGWVLAVLFAIVSALFLLGRHPSDHEAAILGLGFAVLSPVCWIRGRTCKLTALGISSRHWAPRRARVEGLRAFRGNTAACPHAVPPSGNNFVRAITL
jgi:hypothetical protein